MERKIAKDITAKAKGRTFFVQWPSCRAQTVYVKHVGRANWQIVSIWDETPLAYARSYAKAFASYCAFIKWGQWLPIH